MDIIRVSNLSKVYRSTDKESFEVRALDGIDLTIKRGEFVAIMGPSGSGKSTLMQIMGLLDQASSGTYILDNQDISRLDEDELAKLRSQKMGFIFQFFNLLPRTTCLENVGLPLLYAGDTNPGPRAQKLLEDVGLGNRLTHRPHQLSGGQQQRVAIARALANQPKIIFADEPTGNISTQQTEEILDQLDGLNREGVTIVLVTHEPEVAARARRLITIRDGKVFKDETQKMPLVRYVASETEVLNPPPVEVPMSASNWLFRIKENFKMAQNSLSLNKLRTSLATLGVVIGIASFVAMVAIGEGAKRAISEQIASFGTNILNIRPISAKADRGLRGDAFRKFHMPDLEALQAWAKTKNAIKGVDAQVYGNVTLGAAEKNSLSEIIGATPAIETMQNFKPVSGRFFTEEEDLSKARVALIGQTVAKNLFPGINPVGSIIKINRIDFDIIGLLPQKGSTAYKDRDDVVIVPLKTTLSRVLGRVSLNVLTVEATSPELQEQVQLDVTQYMRDSRKITDGMPDNFEVRNMNDIKELYTQTTDIISSMLQAIAAVSLLVGGIGIMNVMFVSVKERTREVGLRKAIGAKRADILIQFLIESILIGLLGGLFGTVTGFVLCQFAESYLGWQAVISWDAILVAFSFSAAVGILFGLWPAKQASELSPIEALRYE